MNKIRAYHIIENLVSRIEVEGLSLRHITNMELESLKYLLSEIDTEEESPDFDPGDGYGDTGYSRETGRTGTPVAAGDFMDDDIPF